MKERKVLRRKVSLQQRRDDDRDDLLTTFIVFEERESTMFNLHIGEFISL